MPSLTLPSPFGPLTITAADGVLTTLEWRVEHDDPSPLLQEAARQLEAYFAGTQHSFALPFDLGQGLHAGVRRAMCAIPYGETRTYGDIARALQTNAQAVGQACGANPLPILIPCHRVTGTHWFGGFSAPGGVWTKAALLPHPGALLLLWSATGTPQTGTRCLAPALFSLPMQHATFARPSMAMPFKGARYPREWRPVAKSCTTP